jgi:hypothetical protein
MLSAASENFALAADHEATSASCGILLLADPQEINGLRWISQLSDSAGLERSTDWRVVSKPDPYTVHLSKEGAVPLVVISGHQAITEEGLEVLVFPKISKTDELLTKPGQVAIADNGGRPRIWRTVPILETAYNRGFQIMSGTDPLPISGELRRIGSFGFTLAGQINSSMSSGDIIRLLCTRELRPFGHLLSLWDFLRKQTALRL